jgi:hypothetical protein
VFGRDLVGEKLEILSPLFGRQSRKRSFTMSKAGSKEQDAEQFFHEAHFRLGGSDLSFWMRNPLEGFNGS